MVWHIGHNLHHAYPVCAVVAPDYLPLQVTGTSGNEPGGEEATRNGDTHSRNLFKKCSSKEPRGVRGV